MVLPFCISPMASSEVCTKAEMYTFSKCAVYEGLSQTGEEMVLLLLLLWDLANIVLSFSPSYPPFKGVGVLIRRLLVAQAREAARLPEQRLELLQPKVGRLPKGVIKGRWPLFKKMGNYHSSAHIFWLHGQKWHGASLCPRVQPHVAMLGPVCAVRPEGLPWIWKSDSRTVKVSYHYSPLKFRPMGRPERWELTPLCLQNVPGSHSAYRYSALVIDLAVVRVKRSRRANEFLLSNI